MENKLYIKVKCSICRGDKPFSCPYCDTLGESYIEASQKTVLRIVKAKIDKQDVFRALEDEDV